MALRGIQSYINSFSREFQSATKAFNELDMPSKIVILFVTIAAGLATLLAGGIGGYAAFKALVDHYTIAKLEKGKNQTADKADGIMQNKLGLSETEESDPAVIKLKKLADQLPAVKFESKFLGVTMQEAMSSFMALGLEDRDKRDAFASEMKVYIKESPQIASTINKILSPFLSNPKKFLSIFHIAFGALNKSQYSCFFKHKTLEEIEGPCEELKREKLDHLMKLNPCFKAENVASVQMKDGDHLKTHTVLSLYLDTTALFGVGNFASKPLSISPIFANSVGVSLTNHLAFIQKHLDEQNPSEQKTPVLLRLRIGEFGDTGIPASMIAPLLPAFQKVPCITTLDLSGVGKGIHFSSEHKGGFGDEHKPMLLDLIKSQPYLIQFNANTDRMTTAFLSDVYQEILLPNLMILSPLE